MSIVTVLEEIDLSLHNLIDKADWTAPGTISDFQKPLITFDSPKDVQGQISTGNKLCIYLYQIMENVYLKNHEPEIIEENRTSFSPLYLDLHYLIVPFCEKKRDEKLILGTIIQIFANQSVLHENLLKGNLGKTDQIMRILFNPLTVDELTKIWSAFQTTGYHPALSYIVTPVPVDISLESTFQRVVSKQFQYCSGYPED
ncbi:MAG: hypothetical protein APR53_02790 [Methanoculleus sp. SDB]|nr:MAG: hypothetical protein APR53_02790 [Methanoculleus sp. SDB]